MFFQKIRAALAQWPHKKEAETMKTDRMTEEKALDSFMEQQFAHNSISAAFPADIASLRAEDLKPAPCRERIDLREMAVLTLDCDETRDMDDAVSLEQTEQGWLLGIHIADVAAYVTPGSRLDEIATERGASIYLPNRTLPMLPPVLSQDLCSLNENRDRNALSLLIGITRAGSVLDYRLCKSRIRSRVKGVYSEVNSIFSHTAARETLRKYRPFLSRLWDLKRLADALRERRCRLGADVAPGEEVKAAVVGGEIQLRLQRQGEAEMLIEELMILANSLVAQTCLTNGLPCLYRTQEEKNRLAGYTPDFTRHSSLAIRGTGYTHFTSPIRRRADCFVHQVLTDWLNGESAEKLRRKYSPELVEEMALIATKRLRRAQTMQLMSLQFCCSRYFAVQSQTVYRGTVVGFNRQKLPILCLEAFPIYVLGSLSLGAQIGERYAFHIAVNDATRKLYAACGRRTAS